MNMIDHIANALEIVHDMITVLLGIVFISGPIALFIFLTASWPV